MGQLSEQLKDYLETTTPEQQEEDFYKICCKIEGLDPNDPKSKKKLERINRRRAMKPVLNKIAEVCVTVLAAQLIMWSCLPLMAEKYPLFFAMHTLGFVCFHARIFMEAKKYN